MNLEEMREYKKVYSVTIKSLTNELSYSESQCDYKNALAISKLINKLRITYIKRLESELKI